MERSKYKLEDIIVYPWDWSLGLDKTEIHVL